MLHAYFPRNSFFVVVCYEQINVYFCNENLFSILYIALSANHFFFQVSFQILAICLKSYSCVYDTFLRYFCLKRENTSVFFFFVWKQRKFLFIVIERDAGISILRQPLDARMGTPSFPHVGHHGLEFFLANGRNTTQEPTFTCQQKLWFCVGRSHVWPWLDSKMFQQIFPHWRKSSRLEIQMTWRCCYTPINKGKDEIIGRGY